MKRIRVVTGRTALGTAVFAVALTGCSVLSPSTITTPYPAADGVGLALPGTSVALRNFLVVGTAKDAPAAVLGTVVNDGDSPAQVTLQTDLGTSGQPTQTVVSIPAHGSVELGPDQAQKMVISDLAVAPGATTEFSAATLAGGRADVAVPVLLPQGIYASLTPAAPTPTVTPVASDTATASSTSTATSSKTKKKNKNKKTSTSTSTSTSSPSSTSTNS